MSEDGYAVMLEGSFSLSEWQSRLSSDIIAFLLLNLNSSRSYFDSHSYTIIYLYPSYFFNVFLSFLFSSLISYSFVSQMLIEKYQDLCQYLI